MAFPLPPPPVSNDPKDPAYRDWFYKLQQYLSIAGNILFNDLNFTDSNITSIETRNHNDLQNLQGGQAGEYYHLTEDEYNELSSGQLVVEHVAATNLGGNRVVFINSSDEAEYADNTVLTNTNIVLGLTTGAVSIGEIARIQTYGQMTEPTWSWTLEQPVFLGTNGLLTQTHPTAPAFALVVGFPVTPTTLMIRFNNPIVLS